MSRYYYARLSKALCSHGLNEDLLAATPYTNAGISRKKTPQPPKKSPGRVVMRPNGRCQTRQYVRMHVLHTRGHYERASH